MSVLHENPNPFIRISWFLSVTIHIGAMRCVVFPIEKAYAEVSLLLS